MDRTSATRLRFKESKSTTQKKKHRSDLEDDARSTHDRRNSRSRSRSPRKSHRDHDSGKESTYHSSGRSSHNHDEKSREKKRARKKYRESSPWPEEAPSSSSFLDGADEEYERYMRNEACFRHEGENEEEQLRQQESENDPWLSRLFEEFSNDNPQDYHSSRFESMYQSNDMERGGGSGSNNEYLNSLSDEHYADYMRRGMSSTARKEHTEWIDWIKDQERIKRQQEKERQREKDERARQRRQEKRERERQQEATKSATHYLRKKAILEKARSDFAKNWKEVMDDKDTPLTLETVPWPAPFVTRLKPTTVETTTTSDLTLDEFLFLGVAPEDDIQARRQILRREQLKFHPDKFLQRFGQRLPVDPTERNAILDTLQMVAQALNRLGEFA
ncbi:hypothetical protein BGZ94_005916 [Podila epigama]|nr:hypothetical protein BGZ94_005916 [Podila epigama]